MGNVNGQLKARRAGLGAAAVGVLVTAMVTFSVLPASASHIAPTGPVDSNCVNFQSNNTGTKTSINFPGGIITLNSWDADGKGFTFTVIGLTGSQFVDTSIKSGQNIDEPGPYSNGTHHVDNTVKQGISHVRLCIFRDPTPPTTTEPPTTTTTIKDEVSPTSIVSTTTTMVGATTTTMVGATTTIVGTTVSSTADTLPFTGFENGTAGLLALVLVATGALALVGTRVFREETDE
jgi:hypothetical protein